MFRLSNEGRKERSGKRFFKKENHARFLKNNPRRRRRRRERALKNENSSSNNTTTIKTNLVLHFQVDVFAFVFFLFFFGIHFI